MNLPLKLVLGFLGGMSATGPMSIGMAALHRRLPWTQSHALPPRQITSRLLEKAGVPVSSEAEQTLTLINHFGYGAAAGGVYASLAADQPSPAIAKGAIFGFGVWFLSYMGLLPALNLMPPATQTDGRRNALMILVHLVWGIFLAIFIDTMKGDARRPNAALVKG